MNGSGVLLVARNIEKSFGNLEILKGPSLDLDTGQIIAITGKSGAGKSTFLHIISSLEDMDAGELMIDGQDVKNLSSREISELRNEKIGFVFQFHHLINEFSATENVMVPLLIRGSFKKEAKEKALSALQFVDLADRAGHLPNELSGGEQQRVAIARAMVHEPKIIFADEPTGNLDTENAAAVIDIFEKIRDEMRTSFVLVTHDLKLAENADRHLVMSDGKFIE